LLSEGLETENADVIRRMADGGWRMAGFTLLSPLPEDHDPPAGGE
jgi:hypothetical protein